MVPFKPQNSTVLQDNDDNGKDNNSAEYQYLIFLQDFIVYQCGIFLQHSVFSYNYQQHIRVVFNYLYLQPIGIVYFLYVRVAYPFRVFLFVHEVFSYRIFLEVQSAYHCHIFF